MKRARIIWDADLQRWVILRGRRARSFRTLLEAENYATRSECPDEVES